ncbi:hypothetical protein ACWDV7_33730 [Streptomyces sp. NPDC003362]
MTATPRICVGAESADTTRPRRHRTTAADADAFANSMDNQAVYGPKIFEYLLAQAVADGRAADYRIVVPTLTDGDLHRRLNLPAPGTTPPGGDGEVQDGALRTTALHLAVLRAMSEHQLKRVLVYVNLVSDARRFARELPHTLRLLRRTDPWPVPRLRPAAVLRPRRAHPRPARRHLRFLRRRRLRDPRQFEADRDDLDNAVRARPEPGQRRLHHLPGHRHAAGADGPLRPAAQKWGSPGLPPRR